MPSHRLKVLFFSSVLPSVHPPPFQPSCLSRAHPLSVRPPSACLSIALSFPPSCHLITSLFLSLPSSPPPPARPPICPSLSPLHASNHSPSQSSFEGQAEWGSQARTSDSPGGEWQDPAAWGQRGLLVPGGGGDEGQLCTEESAQRPRGALTVELSFQFGGGAKGQ